MAFFPLRSILRGGKRTRRLLMEFHWGSSASRAVGLWCCWSQWCLNCCRAELSQGLVAKVAYVCDGVSHHVNPIPTWKGSVAL